MTDLANATQAARKALRERGAADAARFETILHQAFAAAMAASQEAMNKMGSDRFACGFSWASIDGNEPLARFCRAAVKRGTIAGTPSAKHNVERFYGSKGYPSGWQFWNPGRSQWQNIDVKEAGARAFRDKLAEFGIRATVGSRLD